jgi:hypothetical protein
LKNKKFQHVIEDLYRLIDQLNKYDAQEIETEESRLNILGALKIVIEGMETRTKGWKKVS